jgi:DNA invertase Pin-like site-specific DNA recombinase
MRKRLRAALYHRVGTREQNRRLARTELRAAASARGLRVVLDVEETASGRGSVRPGLDRVMDLASRGGLDVVLVQRLDR